MINRIRLKYVTIAISILIGVLGVYELFQLFQLYSQKKTQFRNDAERIVERISYIHEKLIDYQRYNTILTKDFSGLYKKIIENEFEGMLSSSQEISIKDTTIFSNNKIEPYLIIRGSTKDTLSGVQTQQTTLIKDVRQLQDFVSSSKSNAKENITIHLNQKLLQHIFKKAKFMNELMLQAFKENVYNRPQQRVDLRLLDSLVSRELKGPHFPKKYEFCLYVKDGKGLIYKSCPNTYNPHLSEQKGYRTELFPTDKINDKLILSVYFPKERAFLLKEMKSYFIITALLGLLIVFTLYFLIRIIREQKEVSEIKSNFISNMTHEFKTPISTISLACQALNDKDVVSMQGNELFSPYLKMIDEENKRLENLVEGILQSALISKGDMSLNRESVDILMIIRKQIEVAQFKKQPCPNITLKHEGLPRNIEADKMHFTNMVANLLDNAVKYSTAMPTIEINVSFQNNNSVILSVKDQGIGIQPEFLPKIFENLYRVPTGDVHNVKGFGLGLSYVKAIADAHQWKIKVESQLGKGTIFEVFIN